MTSAFNYESDELVTDDEVGRTLLTPTAFGNNVTSPAASRPTSNENTPTALRRNGTLRASPRGKITQWTPVQCGMFVENLGHEYGKYADAFVDEAVTGEVLIIISHDELKELGIVSTGHRLKVLKAIYQVKVRQNIPFEADHYVPLSEANAPDNRPTADDFSALVQALKQRDDRMVAAEAELVKMKEHLDKVWDDTRRLREDMLPVARAVKESSQPLPPEPPKYAGSGPAHLVDIPPPPKGPPPMPHMIDIKPSEGLSRSLSRKLSTRKFPFGTAAKMPSPGTIHEVEAIQAVTSTYLSPGQSLYMTSQQPSPTSPPYSMNTGSIASRTNPRVEEPWSYSNTSSMTHDPRIANPSMSAPPSRRAPIPTPSTNTLSTAASELTTKLGHVNAGSGTPLSMVTPAVSNAEDVGANGLVDRFKVKDQETTEEILPSALKKWHIVGDPKHYNLYIVYGDRERLLMSWERPLMLFKEFQKQDLHPMFMLRKKGNEPDIIAESRRHRNGTVGGSSATATAAASRVQSYISPTWNDFPGGSL